MFKQVAKPKPKGGADGLNKSQLRSCKSIMGGAPKPKQLATRSFLLLVVMHLLLVAMHLLGSFRTD